MASETIDKTMLEAMTCGCFPLTTKRNAQAIGLDNGVDNEEELRAAIQFYCEFDKPATGEELYKIVKEHHSLDALVAKMDAFVSKGI